MDKLIQAWFERFTQAHSSGIFDRGEVTDEEYNSAVTLLAQMKESREGKKTPSPKEGAS